MAAVGNGHAHSLGPASGTAVEQPTVTINQLMQCKTDERTSSPNSSMAWAVLRAESGNHTWPACSTHCGGGQLASGGSLRACCAETGKWWVQAWEWLPAG